MIVGCYLVRISIILYEHMDYDTMWAKRYTDNDTIWVKRHNDVCFAWEH